MSKLKRLVSLLTTITTLFWSLGLSMLIPNVARAAVTATGPFELIPAEGMHLPASSFDSPIVRFALTQSASETLSTVKVTITNNTGGAVTNNVLADHIDKITVWKDANGNNAFEPVNDLIAGEQAIVRVATTTTDITTSSNNTIAASGGLATSFFVVVKTDSTWAQPDSFKVNVAANGITTSAGVLTTTALTGANAVDANTFSGGGGAGFGTQTVTFVNATTVDVVFNDFLDLNTGAATSTGNYTLSGTGASSVTSVIVLSDNKSVRVTASGAGLVSTGASLLAVTNGVKNNFGIANGATAATPIFSGFQPLVISEVKIGSSTDQYDEFIELYNRTGSDFTATSSLKLHVVSAGGISDVSLPLTWNVSSTAPGARVRGNGFLLIAPVTSPASSTADAVYATSSLRQLAPNGAVYISNSSASSTAVIDKVCWGTHSTTSNCEGSGVSSFGTTNDGTSIERKATNSSTAASMATGGADAASGNGSDTNNNFFDFVIRTTPQSQNAGSAVEAPSGGSWGGAGNAAPSIFHTPIFRATTSTPLTVIARMTDDGGSLTSSNAQLIFCATDTTCTPASSTPVFGTSIGSGWFKFSSTTTQWSFGRNFFKYYLLATDSATPAKTRVFTNDPAFDSTESNVNPGSGQTGIQTAALQQSKALTITLVQGNPGSASINGLALNSTGQGVGGATVWIEGAQFSATTGNDGSFSFSNVGPSGGAQLKIAKDGFVDQSTSIFVPPSGLVSLPTITLFGGTMGSGGDFNLPKVTSSNPPLGATGFPTQSPTGGAPEIILNFSKTMDTTTYVTSTAGNAASNIFLTEAGSSTRLAGAVTAPSATQAVFTPSVALTVGKGYTLSVTPGVKDSVGNPVSGNGPGGQFVLFFSTAGQFFSGFTSFTTGGQTFGSGSAFPPFVKGSMPSQGTLNVARNTKVFISFSEAMQDTSGNRANVTLYSVSSPFTASESKSAITATNSFDSSGKVLIISPSANLSATAHYRVEVLGNITSAKGVPLGNPGQTGFATTAFYKGDFDTGSGTDLTAPTVSGTIPATDATGVSTAKPIVISFSEAMNPSTITSTNVSVKLGSTDVSGTLNYDSNTWTANFTPDYAFTATSTYTISISTSVQDLAGNALDTAVLRAFTTGSADTLAPTVLSAQGNDFAMKVSFSEPMLAVSSGDINYSSSVLNPANYSIKQVNSSGVAVSTLTLPSSATLKYDPGTRSVSIQGLPTVSGFTAGTTLLNVVCSNVKDISFNTVSATRGAATSTAQSSSLTGSFSDGGSFIPRDLSGNIIQGGAFGPMSTSLATFTGSGIGFIPSAKVLPLNSGAGLTTTYAVEAPLSKQVSAGGFIEITLPDGVEVTNAKKDTVSPKNNDLNGPSTGVVVLATSESLPSSDWTNGAVSNDGVIVNTGSRTVRVILGSVATRSESGDTHDFLRFDIAGIVNSSIAKSVQTSGDTATVETKSSDGTVIETFTSGSFFTTAGGNFIIRGRVLDSAGNGVNGLTVFAMSPLTGPQSSSTAASRWGGAAGEFLFQNLGAGSYMLGVDQFSKSAGTSYSGGPPQPLEVNATTCPASTCTRNISVADSNDSAAATVTLSISGTFSNDAIDIFAGGPGSFRMATTTLNGTLTNNTSNSIKLNANGIWMVGFGPAMAQGFNVAKTAAPTAWIPPKPKEVLVTGCPSACVASPSTITFSSSVANKTIKGTVQDASGNKIGNAQVFAYSPLQGLGNHANANADGTFSLNMSTGTFKIGAFVQGMPPSSEKSISMRTVSGVDKVFIDGASTGITLSTMAATDLVIIIAKPSLTITGKVTDGTNPIANTPVFAYRTDGPGNVDTFTNSSGEYTLYVSNGTWKAKTFLPQFGELPEKTITVSGSSASGQNFEPNTSATTFASITKSIVLDSDGSATYSAVSDQELSNVQVTVKGTTGDVNNDGDTSDAGENVSYINSALTDTNGSSTLKVPPGTYTMTAWSPVFGDLPAFSSNLVVNSAGTATTLPSDLLTPATSTVTINILDVNGNATTTDKVIVEFQQIGGKINNSTSFDSVASSTFSLPVYDAGANNVAIGNVTGTSPANFYLMQVLIPGVAQSDLLAYASNPSTTIMATSTVTSGLWKVEVDANEIINIRLPAINYVTGTVKDENGTAVPDATVHIENKTTGDVVEVKADGSGNYSTKLSSGTYLVQADKAGYIDTATTVSVTTNGAIADSATTVDAFDYSITGTITAGGSAVVGGTVRGEKLGGGVVTATTGADGTYTLKVTTGDWKVTAVGEGYSEAAYSTVVGVSANVTGVNIALTSTKTGLAGTTSLSVTPQTGGSLSDSSANLDILAPASSLSSSRDSQPLSDKEVSNVVTGGSGAPIAGEAKEIKSYDTDGNLLTTLNNDIGVRSTYSTTELASTVGTLTIAKIENVEMSSWDSSSDNWENLPTTIAYKDSSGNFVEPTSSLSTVSSVSYTGFTTHLSVFNPTVPSDGLAPATPSGFGATGGNAQISFTWSAPTTNADGSSLTDLLGYELYRSTSAGGTYTQINTSDITGTTYTDAGLSAGTTYFYKITAADTGGLESAMSSAVSAATNAASTGGGGGGAAAPAVTSNSLAINNGALSTTSREVTLTLSAPGAGLMAISNDANFTGVSFESYATSKSWTLTAGLGKKAVYAKFRSAGDGVSGVVAAEITLVAPTAPPAVAPPAPPGPPAPLPEAVPVEVLAPPAVPVPTKAVSDVAFVTLPKSSVIKTGQSLRFTYTYVNPTEKSQKIRIVRELINPKGKSVTKAQGQRVVKSGAEVEVKVTQPIHPKLAAGAYTVAVKVYDAKTGKLLDENSFEMTVEKPAPKKPVKAAPQKTAPPKKPAPGVKGKK